MAIAEREIDVPGVTRPMTYEEYMASPEEMARYDILDGWKVYRRYGEEQSTNPTREHQEIQGNLYIAFRTFAAANRQCKAIQAPCDVKITRLPLHNRQPDILLISKKRLAQNSPPNNPAPLSPAPELVVEILSPSDKATVLAAKIADYHAADVQEVWIARSENQTIEIIRLSIDEIESQGVYGFGQSAASTVFERLAVLVDTIFTE